MYCMKKNIVDNMNDDKEKSNNYNFYKSRVDATSELASGKQLSIVQRKEICLEY